MYKIIDPNGGAEALDIFTSFEEASAACPAHCIVTSSSDTSRPSFGMHRGERILKRQDRHGATDDVNDALADVIKQAEDERYGALLGEGASVEVAVSEAVDDRTPERQALDGMERGVGPSNDELCLLAAQLFTPFGQACAAGQLPLDRAVDLSVQAALLLVQRTTTPEELLRIATKDLGSAATESLAPGQSRSDATGARYEIRGGRKVKVSD